MKKILLYYPKLTGDCDSHPLYTGLPLSVLTLSAQFNPQEFDIRIIDGRIEKNIIQEVIEWLDDDTVCIGISSMTSYQIRDGLNVAHVVREKRPDIPVIWGGWHPSLMPHQTIEHKLVDIVVIGQGERTFTQLVEQLASKGDIRYVPNIMYKNASGEIVETKIDPLRELSEIQTAKNAFRLIDVEPYVQTLWGNDRVLGYESSRGCPWRCKFCSIGAVYNGHWNAFSAERVVDDIEFMYRNYNIDAIHFYDNNFFVNIERARKISLLLVERGINIKWDGTAVVEQFVDISHEFLEQLKSSGFFRVIVGIESGDEDVLKMIDKRHNNKQVLDLVDKCNQLGIMMSFSFMIGFPWNPEKDVKETIHLIEEIKNRSSGAEILLFIFSPYVGTKLHEVALQYGMKFPECLEGWSGYTYEKSNVPWISEQLLRKINRYISFFGTKDLSPEALKFLKGSSK